MRKSKFSEELIAMALRQAEAGTPVEEICRKLGVSSATLPPRGTPDLRSSIASGQHAFDESTSAGSRRSASPLR